MNPDTPIASSGIFLQGSGSVQDGNLGLQEPAITEAVESFKSEPAAATGNIHPVLHRLFCTVESEPSCWSWSGDDQFRHMFENLRHIPSRGVVSMSFVVRCSSQQLGRRE